MASVKPDEKMKAFRLNKELAYEFELHAKLMRTTEVKLITRYIQEGMMRDKNQTKLDIKQ